MTSGIIWSGLVWLAETLSKLFSLLFAQNKPQHERAEETPPRLRLVNFPATATATQLQWLWWCWAAAVSRTIRIYKNNPQSIRARAQVQIVSRFLLCLSETEKTAIRTH